MPECLGSWASPCYNELDRDTNSYRGGESFLKWRHWGLGVCHVSLGPSSKTEKRVRSPLTFYDSLTQCPPLPSKGVSELFSVCCPG